MGEAGCRDLSVRRTGETAKRLPARKALQPGGGDGATGGHGETENRGIGASPQMRIAEFGMPNIWELKRLRKCIRVGLQD